MTYYTLFSSSYITSVTIDFILLLVTVLFILRVTYEDLIFTYLL